MCNLPILTIAMPYCVYYDSPSWGAQYSTLYRYAKV